MARSRNIKPGLFKNEILGIADPIYTLAFEGLWLLADRSGRLEDRPIRIRGEVFPYRVEVDMNLVLAWLADNGFIYRYEAGGIRYIEIVHFAKHQNPHKNEAESEIPPYAPIACTNTEKIGTKPEKIGSARADSLNLIPDSLIPDSLKKSGRAKRSPQIPLPTDFSISERVRTWAARKGFDQIEQHFEFFVSKCKAKGYVYADWDEGFMGAVAKDWAELRSGKSAGKNGNGGMPWWSSDATILAKGRECNLTPRPGESMHEFKGRINVALEATA